MTRRAELPADVRRFIIERIDSVPQLEALIMMNDEPRDWTTVEIAARTYVPLDQARALLESLQRARLIVATEAPGSFSFAPAENADRALVSSLAHEYRANLILVATLIHDKGSSAVREFARAFDLKKDR